MTSIFLLKSASSIKVSGIIGGGDPFGFHQVEYGEPGLNRVLKP
jgi:hypothetical protein